MRKTNLAPLLARRVDGIHLPPCEQGEIGPDLFRHACLMGLAGLVSKHRDSAYRGGRVVAKTIQRAHLAQRTGHNVGSKCGQLRESLSAKPPAHPRAETDGASD